MLHAAGDHHLVAVQHSSTAPGRLCVAPGTCRMPSCITPSTRRSQPTCQPLYNAGRCAHAPPIRAATTHSLRACADRDIHLVGIGADHHRVALGVFPGGRAVCAGHGANDLACHVHVEYAVRVLDLVQDAGTLRTPHGATGYNAVQRGTTRCNGVQRGATSVSPARPFGMSCRAPILC